MSRYFVRMTAGGCVIASQGEDDQGQPLTQAEAEKLCRRENAEAERARVARGHKSRFEFYVAEVKP